MLRPWDTVRVNDRYPDLAYLKGQTFRIGSMGTVCGTKVVWLFGHGAPVSCIAADAVEKIMKENSVKEDSVNAGPNQ